jgi:hypothetical protein
VLDGAGYGRLLDAIMNYVVVPPSAARGGGSGGALWVTLSIIVHTFLIGVSIASFTSGAFSPRKTETKQEERKPSGLRMKSGFSVRTSWP